MAGTEKIADRVVVESVLGSGLKRMWPSNHRKTPLAKPSSQLNLIQLLFNKLLMLRTLFITRPRKVAINRWWLLLFSLQTLFKTMAILTWHPLLLLQILGKTMSLKISTRTINSCETLTILSNYVGYEIASINNIFTLTVPRAKNTQSMSGMNLMATKSKSTK